MNGGGGKKGIGVIIAIAVVVFVALFAIANIGAIGGVLSSVISVFSPIIIGFGIAYILNPLLRLFEFKVFKRLKSKNVIRVLSIVCTFVSAALIVAALLWLLIPQIVNSIEQLVSQYEFYIARTTGIINSIINKFLSNENFAVYVDAEHIREVIQHFFSISGDALNSIMGYVKEYGMGLFVGVKNTVLGVFIAIYVLISKEKLQAQVRKFGTAVMPENKLKVIGRYINLTHHTFSSYFVGKILSSMMVMLIVFVAMLIFNIPYALLIAVVIGVTDIIPVFGPFIGTIPSFIIIFIVEPEKALLFLIIILVVQQIEGNIISPKVLGEATGVSSLCVIISIIIMGEYFGVVGMIIGVPVFAVGVTVVKELVESRLKKKQKPVDTAEYYLKDSVADPYAHHEPVASRLFKAAKRLFTLAKDKIVELVRKIKNKSSEAKKNTAEDVSEEPAEEQQRQDKEQQQQEEEEK